MSRPVSVIAVEGVLGRYPPSLDRYASMPTIESGMALLRGLNKVGPVILLSSFSDTDKIHHWLKVQMIMSKDYEKLVPRSHAHSDMDEVTLRLQQINLVRYYNYPINMLIDSSSEVIAKAFSMGITCVLFAHPSYMRPEHRPDVEHSPRSWDAIERDAIRQRELMATDPRREEA
jgi:hypothetical protein